MELVDTNHYLILVSITILFIITNHYGKENLKTHPLWSTNVIAISWEPRHIFFATGLLAFASVFFTHCSWDITLATIDKSVCFDCHFENCCQLRVAVDDYKSGTIYPRYVRINTTDVQDSYDNYASWRKVMKHLKSNRQPHWIGD